VMVAALAPAPATQRLPLLIDPDRPQERSRAHRFYGWHRDLDGWTRWRGDDSIGAIVQHAIVRYIVHGVSRAQIAEEVGYSERQVQSWICGRAIRPYTQPVLRALTALGISVGKGTRTQATPRMLEILAAYESLLDDAAGRLFSDQSRDLK